MEEKSKKLSKEEMELFANKYVEQQKAARVRAKKNAQQRKEAGIKLLSINLPEDGIDRFKNLLQRTGANKTALFMHMISLCENALDEQEQQQVQQQEQQQIQRQTQQHHNQQSQQQQNQQKNQQQHQQPTQNTNRR